jgi:hypothetical protein
MTNTLFPARRRARAVVAMTGILVLGLPGSLKAQAGAARDSTTPPPAAKPADVASMDAILRALYDVISGPAGPRDWQRFRSLFVPGARLIPTRHDSTGHITIAVMSPDDYARRAGSAFMNHAFFERQIGQTVETFGAVTHVFSAYASRHAADDAAPFARGINSMQLFNDGTRWYVVTIYWDAERPGTTIPAQYLNGM